MVTRQITYAAVLIGSALFYVLYSHWFSWYLLVLLILLLPFDLIVSLPGMLNRRVMITARNVLEQGEAGVVTVTTLQKKPFPARCVKVWLWIYGDDFAVFRRFTCGAEDGSKYEIVIDTSRSGLTVFELKRVWAVSLIGIFSIPTAVNCRTSVLVLPVPVKPPNTIKLSRDIILRPKPGGGFAEDYDLRHYRPGDPVKSIHWKVSAKLDSIIIREPLVPVSHSRLVRVSKWDGAQERDLILGRLRWVSEHLLKWEQPYFVRFGDCGPVAEITEDGALEDYLYRMMDGTAHKLPVPTGIPVRFSWVFNIDAKEE